VSERRNLRETLGSILESWGMKLSAARRPFVSSRALELYLAVANERILVGRLTQEANEFVFRYAEGFRRSDRPGVAAFPDKDREYRSIDLWPFFQVRLPPTERADVLAVLEEQKLHPDDVLGVLAVLGAKSVSTPYEFRLAPSR
jgi:hypothetical protein